MANFPQRIACLQPSVSTTMEAMGLAGRIVACTKWCVELCPSLEAREVRVISDSWSAKAEEIAASHPDLVIASVPYRMEAVAEILKTGLPFLGLAPHSLQDVYGDIARIAGILGESARGERLIAEMQGEMERVRRMAYASVSGQGERPAAAIAPLAGREGGTVSAANVVLPSDRRPLVYCEEWGKPMIHSQGWVKELVEIAGGEFLGEPGKHATAEAIASADPDVMIFAWCGAGDRVPVARVLAARHWTRTKAATSGRAHCLRDEWLNTPGPTLIQGLHALAEAIQPQAFQPQATAGALPAAGKR